MVWSRVTLVTLSLCSFIACGGAKAPPPVTPESDVAATPAPTAAPAPEASAPAAPAAESEKPAADAAPAAAPADGDKSAAAKEGGAEGESGRNVKYIVNPEGMRVEVEGVTFSPKAEAVKSGAGWAVKVKVEVRAKDGNAHSLLAPTGTEVAIAGVVKRSGQAEPEMLSDHRDGDKEIVLKDKPVTLTRTWPGPGGKVLGAGDEAQLLIGIWGLGENAASRRPVRKLCKLTVKLDKAKPKVSLGAPDGIGK